MVEAARMSSLAARASRSPLFRRMLHRSFPKFLSPRAVLLAGILGLSACKLGTEVCPALRASSLAVRVTDAKTGAYVASGATLRWRSGAFQGTGNLVLTSEPADASAFI